MKEIKIFALDENYEIMDGKARPVKSIAEMKAIDDLKAGNIIRTIGYYSANDGGGATYLIREKTETDIEDLGTIHFINDTLVAELQFSDSQKVYAKQFGVKSDKKTDDSIALQKAIDYCKTTNKILILDGYAYVTNTIDTKGTEIKGIGTPAKTDATHTSKKYGYIGWDYLRNINNGALITFEDYCEDILISGSGICSDIANPILKVDNSVGKFHLENLCICGWIRTENQIGIEEKYSEEDATHIRGGHDFRNLNVINCGSHGILIHSLESKNVENVRCLYNFGHGMYIKGIIGFDTPFEYCTFTNCHFDGNKQDGFFAENCFRKCVEFNHCRSINVGLYQQLNITPPATTKELISAFKIKGNNPQNEDEQKNLVFKNCFAEECEKMIHLETNNESGTNQLLNCVDINHCFSLHKSAQTISCLAYIDAYYSHQFSFYSNIGNCNKAIVFGENCEHINPLTVDKEYYKNFNKNTPEITVNDSLNLTTKEIIRRGNQVILNIFGTANADINSYTNIVSNLPKPITTTQIPMFINRSNSYMATIDSTRALKSPRKITSGEVVAITATYNVEEVTDKNGG